VETIDSRCLSCRLDSSFSLCTCLVAPGKLPSATNGCPEDFAFTSTVRPAGSVSRLRPFLTNEEKLPPINEVARGRLARPLLLTLICWKEQEPERQTERARESIMVRADEKRRTKLHVLHVRRSSELVRHSQASRKAKPGYCNEWEEQQDDSAQFNILEPSRRHGVAAKNCNNYNKSS
jgi:hypothetical protein